MKFSPRRKELLSYLCLGFRAEEISLMMHVASTTTKTQLSNLFAQTGTISQGELIAMAFNEGWVQPNKNYWKIREQKINKPVYKIIRKMR